MDREKIIKGLIEIEKIISNGKITICEPEAWSGSIHMIEAAIALLKEQEPVKPTYEDFFGNRIARCGKCNGYIVRYKYCPGRGQEVKWE